MRFFIRWAEEKQNGVQCFPNGPSHLNKTILFKYYFLLGLKSNELTLLPVLFHNFSKASYWKVDFIINNYENKTSSGMASLILKTNEVPSNGQCNVDLLKGVGLSTYFTITCSNWTDSDGVIVKYEFMGKIYLKYFFSIWNMLI